VNVVDSSGWLEFFADGPNAGFFAEALQATDELAVPVVSIYEVFKRVLAQRGEGDALQAVALMQQGTVIDLTTSAAMDAARLSVEAGLPMADAIILSTARGRGAILWTQDAHFLGMDGVRYSSAGSDRQGPPADHCS
jgi:toxin FitB